jgi:hypothetical protein
MTELKKVQLKSKFSDILDIIIADIDFADTSVLPEVSAILNSLEIFVKDEEAKKVIKAIIDAIADAQKITPDIVKLLEDLRDLLK